ncbi:MAG: adenylate/guanylate cyclase domain-containing protein [Pseudomonadota bacterium]|nr:adenylate/guanylate cyclase domain-containing protein [Pseudomonadota bacterium]
MESSSRTLVCSVLFLDIVEYSKKPVAEQLQLKQAFNQALGKALAQVASRDRIILDTGDGAAVTFVGDPEDALFASMSMRDLLGPVPVRLGVNLGPVRLVKDLNGQMNIIGDGINVAQRVMSFSRAGQLLVSRSFYEVVSCLSRDYQNLFHHEGSRTDKHVREHEVYSVVGGTPSTRRLADTLSDTDTLVPESGTMGWLRRNGPYGLRRSAMVAAPLVFMLIVAGGVGARAVMNGATPVAKSKPPPKAAAVPAPVAAASPPAMNTPQAAKPEFTAPKADTSPPVEKKEKLARLEKKLERVEQKDNAPISPGASRIVLAVAPWGEVLIDGQSRGVSPPLRELEISPGPHTIEIRNSTFPAHVQRVEVKAGEAVRIRHRFK